MKIADKKIIDYNEKELKLFLNNCKIFINFLGINDISEPELLFFKEILVEHYPKLSYNEIKEAFKMFHLRKLEKYLPDNPSYEHYNKFSTPYYMKVLTAYYIYKKYGSLIYAEG